MDSATRSSTTSSARRGRPPGNSSKDRRLTREIANKEFTLRGLEALGGFGLEFVRTANSNPITGLALGIATTSALHRTGILGDLEAGLIYGFIGAKVAGDIISDFAHAVPFSSADNSRDGVQPSATALSYGAAEKGLTLSRAVDIAKIAGSVS